MRPNPDKDALASVGRAVRNRLASDTSVYCLTAERIELFAVGDFLSAAQCDALIAMVDAHAHPSSTFDPENPDKYRTSHSGDFDRSDMLVRSVERQIDDLLGLPGAFGETLQGQRYTAGQEYRGHHDWFYTDQPYWPGEARNGGQRSWTTMAYLNDVQAGGSTDFVSLGLSVTPKRGVLLAWNNALADGTPNPDTLHAAKPVTAGVKYVVTRWYRTRRWGMPCD